MKYLQWSSSVVFMLFEYRKQICPNNISINIYQENNKIQIIQISFYIYYNLLTGSVQMFLVNGCSN